MKSVIFVFVLSFAAISSWSQLRMNVEGNAEISGSLTAGSGTFFGNSPLRVTTTATSVLDLRGSNPLVEFRDNTVNANYLAFVQCFGADFYLANRQAGSMFFRTSNLNRMTILANGNVGIGTSAAGSKLTVNGLENDGTVAGIEVLSGAEKLIMDGNEIDCTSGGLHLNFNSQNDVLIRTATRRAEVTMVHNNGSGISNGISIEHPGSNNAFWTMYSTNSDGNLELYYQGALRGEFISGTGTYTSVSDRRMKQKIQPLEDILERIARLKPSSYSFRSDASGKTNLGFIAQDVQPLFPELVNQGKVGDTEEEIYTMDYSGFGVIAIAAIQELLEREKTENAELKAKNREMQKRISSLADRLDQLEYQLSHCCRSEGILPATQPNGLNSVVPADRPLLAQNVPNPFSQETSIQYYLPQTVEKAEIFLTDQNGRRIHSFFLNQTGYGKVSIEAGLLTTGIYTYSLVIDGAIWQSLQMVVTK